MNQQPSAFLKAARGEVEARGGAYNNNNKLAENCMLEEEPHALQV